MKKLLALMLALSMLLSCAMAETAETTETAEPAAEVTEEVTVDAPAEEPAEDPVVIQLGENVIHKSDVQNYLDYYTQQYGVTDPEQVAQLTEMLVNAIASQLAVEAKMAELHVDLTEEEQMVIFNEYYAYYQYMANMLGITDLSQVDAETSQAIQSYVSSYFGMDYAQMVWSAQYQKLYDLVTAEAAVTDEDVQAAYEAGVAANANITAAEYANALDQGKAVYVIPEGLRYVKNILIKKDEDAATETDVAADASYAEQWPNATAKADEVLALLASGADFDEVMAQYTEDPGMDVTANGTTGYLVYDGINFDSAFMEAANALQNPGDYSDKTPGIYGYYIVGLASIVEPGVIPFEQIKDAVTADALTAAKDAIMAAKTQEWAAEAVINLDAMK